jgi:hypothetical protein
MDVSCWTFIRMGHLAEPLMRKSGSLFTMAYYGSQMVVKNYNIMGVAKAALESAVRYIAAELGPKGIRVHAISPGPLATRAASGIPEFDALLEKAKAKPRDFDLGCAIVRGPLDDGHGPSQPLFIRNPGRLRELFQQVLLLSFRCRSLAHRRACLFGLFERNLLHEILGGRQFGK